MTPLPPRGTTLLAPSDEGFVDHDDGTFDVWSEAFEDIDQATLEALDREHDRVTRGDAARRAGDAS
jgi:hypothetical protein